MACSFIKYKVNLALSDPPVAYRCNCTICQKAGFTSLYPSPADFELTAPASRSDVPKYSACNPNAAKYFCDKCGVTVFGEGSYEYNGKTVQYFSINLNTLDQPQDGLDLSLFKMKYADGLHDNFMAGGKDVPWPNGAV